MDEEQGYPRWRVWLGGAALLAVFGLVFHLNGSSAGAMLWIAALVVALVAGVMLVSERGG